MKIAAHASPDTAQAENTNAHHANKNALTNHSSTHTQSSKTQHAHKKHSRYDGEDTSGTQYKPRSNTQPQSLPHPPHETTQSEKDSHYHDAQWTRI